MRPCKIFLPILYAVLTLSLLAQQTTPLAAQAAQPQAAQAPSTPPPPHTLMDGTPVKLRLSQTISSADAKTGQEIPFEVVEEVKVDDIVVLPKGANATASVTEADHKKTMGRAGKLNIAISYARLADNEKVSLRAIKESKGGGHVGAMTGAMVATSIVFFPAAPLFLFIHGKDVTIPQGTEITAFVEGDMHLDMSHFGAAPPSNPSYANVPTPAAPQEASIVIDSTPAGAEIEVDGAFVGNAPSTISATPGAHEIVVKKKGFATWTRKLNVTAGSVHVNAELEPQAATTPASLNTPQ
jgi:hypothetical protein